jgi:hypothetical protein
MCDDGDKGIAIDGAQGSRIVRRGRTKVYMFAMTAIAAASDCKIYDGIDANGRLKDRLAAAAQSGDWHEYIKGAYFEQGVFVENVANNPFITVYFAPLPDNEQEL